MDFSVHSFSNASVVTKTAEKLQLMSGPTNVEMAR